MNNLPDVLGLFREDALTLLASAGFSDVDVIVSGRRRDGRPRAIRLKLVEGKPELVVSYFKELITASVAFGDTSLKEGG